MKTVNNWFDMDSFGDNCPANWADVVTDLNNILVEKLHGSNEESIVKSKAAQIWEDYCEGSIFGDSGNSVWYAVMYNSNDTDWSYGTFVKSRAFEMLSDCAEDGYIAVIDGNVCINEIRL